MATATKESRSARTARSPVLKPGVPASTEFLICEENSGSYHWRIVADDGADDSDAERWLDEGGRS